MRFWPFSVKTRNDDIPYYSRLDAQPSRTHSQELAKREESEDFSAWRQRIESDLEAAGDTAKNLPIIFLQTGMGYLTIQDPQLEGACIPAFSTPMRAADYARIYAQKQKFQYHCCNAEETAIAFREFQRAGVLHVALDRCPRCNVFTSVALASLNSPEHVIKYRRITKASEIARCSLYFDYARTAARNGDAMTALDVALETVGHVTAEDARVHLLLGKLALHLKDRTFLREARSFLMLLKQGAFLQELQAAEKTGDWQF